MDAKATRPGSTATARRWVIDLVMLVAIGLLMGFLGPFGSDRIPTGGRYVYWMICMVGGGLIGIAGDEILTRWAPSMWKRVGLVSVLMTPAVSLLVLSTE
ncbi:MAG: histidine kinase, partial [Brevundimonas sp.]|nr:histidine kinase [Brevundimonas sp.]